MVGVDISNHSKFYQKAKLYDIAFDFKDIQAECEFLYNLPKKLAQGNSINSFLECGAGPSLHTIEMARRGIKSIALDISPEMVEYGKDKALKESVTIEYRCGNMIDFLLDQKVDLVATLMDSISYIYTNDEFVKHLKTIAGCLNKNGLYILEMLHPRDLFGVGKSTETNWEMERDKTKVRVRWGKPEDFFDPITQITQTSVSLEYWDNGEKGAIDDLAPQRKYTYNELIALVKLSECFEMIAIYGAMDFNVPFDNNEKAWRMVPVLRKKDL
jgi:SAM-dependent methyltransferase